MALLSVFSGFRCLPNTVPWSDVLKEITTNFRISTTKSGILCEKNSQISQQFPDFLEKSGNFGERGGQEKLPEKPAEKLSEKPPEKPAEKLWEKPPEKVGNPGKFSFVKVLLYRKFFFASAFPKIPGFLRKIRDFFLKSGNIF